MRVRLGRWWEDAIERGDPRFSIHVGRFFGRLSTHSVGGEAVFNIPPSVALPRVSSLYFGAHGPHWSGVLTPGGLVPTQTTTESTASDSSFPPS